MQVSLIEKLIFHTVKISLPLFWHPSLFYLLFLYHLFLGLERQCFCLKYCWQSWQLLLQILIFSLSANFRLQLQNLNILQMLLIWLQINEIEILHDLWDYWQYLDNAVFHSPRFFQRAMSITWDFFSIVWGHIKW